MGSVNETIHCHGMFRHGGMSTMLGAGESIHQLTKYIENPAEPGRAVTSAAPTAQEVSPETYHNPLLIIQEHYARTVDFNRGTSMRGLGIGAESAARVLCSLICS